MKINFCLIYYARPMDPAHALCAQYLSVLPNARYTVHKPPPPPCSTHSTVPVLHTRAHAPWCRKQAKTFSNRGSNFCNFILSLGSRKSYNCSAMINAIFIQKILSCLLPPVHARRVRTRRGGG